MTFRELRDEGRAVLGAAGVPDCDYDAVALLQEAAGLDYGGLFAKLSEEAPGDTARRYSEMIRERAARRPLQHIVGTAWFMGLPFHVCSDVLCPRQDTETLAEAALSAARLGLKPKATYENGASDDNKASHENEPAYENEAAAGACPRQSSLLDLCTGSGCLAVSLAVLGEFDKVVATDLSAAALAVARRNAELNGCQIDFRQGDLFETLTEEERFDIIVCNPPYIPSRDLKGLMPEVRDYEPEIALDGGSDGLDFYRRLSEGLWRFLAPEGTFFLECGAGQGDDVIGLLESQELYEELHVIYDLAGHDRVVSGRRRA
jgi:release factor glutamine methyltransferase